MVTSCRNGNNEDLNQIVMVAMVSIEKDQQTVRLKCEVTSRYLASIRVYRW